MYGDSQTQISAQMLQYFNLFVILFCLWFFGVAVVTVSGEKKTSPTDQLQKILATTTMHINYCCPSPPQLSNIDALQTFDSGKKIKQA